MYLCVCIPCVLFPGLEIGVLGILSRGTKASVPTQERGRECNGGGV